MELPCKTRPIPRASASYFTRGGLGLSMRSPRLVLQAQSPGRGLRHSRMSDTTRRLPALRQTNGPLPGGGRSLSPGLDSCLEDLSSWKPFTGEEGGPDLASPHFLCTESGLLGPRTGGS